LELPGTGKGVYYQSTELKKGTHFVGLLGSDMVIQRRILMIIAKFLRKYWIIGLGFFLFVNCSTITSPQSSPPLSNTEVIPPTVAETPTLEVKNKPPVFPPTVVVESTTENEYDAGQFLTLVGAITTITITGAIDPDGDALTYTWEASNGSISWEDNSATWIREVFANRIKNGTVIVTVEDGKGGSATHRIEFTAF
jgi:hypothetical protein